MYQLRSWLADRLLAVSSWIRPAGDCVAGTGWASASEFQHPGGTPPPETQEELGRRWVGRGPMDGVAPWTPYDACEHGYARGLCFVEGCAHHTSPGASNE